MPRAKQVLDMGGFKIATVADPTVAQDATTKAYVDGQFAGLLWLPPVFAACDVWIDTSAPGSTFDGQTIPGVGSRLLLLNQESGAGALSKPELNGVWVYNGAAVPLTRPTDFDSAADVKGSVVSVMEGAKYHDTIWMQTYDPPFVFGTDPIQMKQLDAPEVIVSTATPPNLPSMTDHPLLWVDTDDPGGGGGAALVTSLPANPIDGQECYFQADATNGVVWHLRYNAASASAYKWEFLGGSPLRATVNTDETFTAGATYVDCATVGPQITLPLVGDYSYNFTVNLYVAGQTALGNGAVGLSLAGAQPNVPDLSQAYLSSGIGGAPGRVGTLLSQPASRVVKIMYAIGTTLGGTPHARMRELQITPVRVG
jgi:hypothetical protein